MPTVEEEEDAIIESELAPAQLNKLAQIIDNAPYVTTVLLAIEQWLRNNDDPKGAAIVEKATLKLARHEAEEMV